MNKLLLQAPTWMNPAKNILSEKKQTQRNENCECISKILRAAKLTYGTGGQDHRYPGRKRVDDLAGTREATDVQTMPASQSGCWLQRHVRVGGSL